jgi:hypothetical protein
MIFVCLRKKSWYNDENAQNNKKGKPIKCVLIFLFNSYLLFFASLLCMIKNRCFRYFYVIFYPVSCTYLYIIQFDGLVVCKHYRSNIIFESEKERERERMKTEKQEKK